MRNQPTIRRANPPHSPVEQQLIEYMRQNMHDPSQFNVEPEVDGNVATLFCGRDVAVSQAARAFMGFKNYVDSTTNIKMSSRVHEIIICKVPACCGLPGLGKTRFL